VRGDSIRIVTGPLYTSLAGTHVIGDAGASIFEPSALGFLSLILVAYNAFVAAERKDRGTRP
jgi:hypothetical protein